MTTQGMKRQILNDAAETKAVGTLNGRELFSFDDANTRNMAELIEDEPHEGRYPVNPNGEPAGVTRHAGAVNIDTLCLNRIAYKGKPGNKRMLVVCGSTGYQAIKGQETGMIPTKTIPAYEFRRDQDTKELVLTGVVKVTDQDFINDFTKHLSNEDMLSLMSKLGETRAEADASPIEI